MRYILCLVVTFMFSNVAMAKDMESMMWTQKDLERQAKEIESSLTIEPVPEMKKQPSGIFDTAFREVMCGDMRRIVNVVKAEGAIPIFAGKTLLGEHVQLFTNPESGAWLIVSAGPKAGEGCSLGGGEESFSLVLKSDMAL